MNLLKETLDVMKTNHYFEEDVVWCGNKDIWFTWEEFRELADTEYDNSYGAAEVAVDLVVVLVDGSYLSRTEYDGSEAWVHHKAPQKPDKHVKPKRLTQKNGLWPWIYDFLDNDEE